MHCNKLKRESVIIYLFNLFLLLLLLLPQTKQFGKWMQHNPLFPFTALWQPICHTHLLTHYLPKQFAHSLPPTPLWPFRLLAFPFCRIVHCDPWAKLCQGSQGILFCFCMGQPQKCGCCQNYFIFKHTPTQTHTDTHKHIHSHTEPHTVITTNFQQRQNALRKLYK